MNQKTWILILAVLLALAVGYIAISSYNAAKQQEQFNIYQQGYFVGYQGAVTQLLQQAQNCRPVPVTMGNYTLNMIAVECLQQSQIQ